MINAKSSTCSFFSKKKNLFKKKKKSPSYKHKKNNPHEIFKYLNLENNTFYISHVTVLGNWDLPYLCLKFKLSYVSLSFDLEQIFDELKFSSRQQLTYSFNPVKIKFWVI